MRIGRGGDSGAAREGTPPGGEVREDKLAALRERLLSEAAAVRTAGDWAGCLRAAARLPGHSFANIMLIEAQRPGATLVQGYGVWQAAGRQVTRGEQRIQVFPGSRSRPGRAGRGAGGVQARNEPGLPAPGWHDASRVDRVWDISQASGPAATARPALPGVPGQAHFGLWDSLCWLARREGFTVGHEQGAPADGVTLDRPPHPRPAGAGRDDRRVGPAQRDEACQVAGEDLRDAGPEPVPARHPRAFLSASGFRELSRTARGWTRNTGIAATGNAGHC